MSENYEMIAAANLPTTDAKEVDVICVENGELKRKPGASLGGGKSHIVYADDSMIGESDEGLIISPPDNYDDFAEDLYNGGNLQVDLSNTEFCGGLPFCRLVSVTNIYIPGMGFVAACYLNGMTIQVLFTNGTWTPPTTTATT